MFSSEEFVEKLVTFLSMEEVKGKDHFDVHKYILFKVNVFIVTSGLCNHILVKPI